MLNIDHSNPATRPILKRNRFKLLQIDGLRCATKNFSCESCLVSNILKLLHRIRNGPNSYCSICCLQLLILNVICIDQEFTTRCKKEQDWVALMSQPY